MEKINNHRPYAFSADMNLRSMYSLTVIAYASIFVGGAQGAMQGNVVVPGQALSTFWLNSMFWGALTVMVVSFFFYLRAMGRAMNGEDGVQYYEPKATSLVDYVKNAFILLILMFFIVVQSVFLFDSFQGGFTYEPTAYVSFLLMVYAVAVGTVGMIQAIGLHLRFNKRIKPA